MWDSWHETKGFYWPQDYSLFQRNVNMYPPLCPRSPKSPLHTKHKESQWTRCSLQATQDSAVLPQSYLACLYCTCDMLRLHGACFHQEGLSTLERQDRLSDQPALSLRRVTAVVQLDDLLEVGCLSVGWDAVLVTSGLHAVHNRTGHTLWWAEDSCAGTLQVSSCRKVINKLDYYIFLIVFIYIYSSKKCVTLPELCVLAVDLWRSFDFLLRL